MPDSRSGDPGSKGSESQKLPAGAPLAKKIIIVTGTPGVGKTRLANAMAKRTGLPAVGLSELVKKNSLYTDFDRKRRSYIIDEGKARVCLRVLIKQARAGLLIDTHLIDQLFPKNVKPTTVVLRLDPVTLSRRLRHRGWAKSKVRENVEAEMIDLSLIDAIQAFGKSNVSEINSTGKSASNVLSEAMQIISKPKPKKHKRVDWLAKYDPIELGRQL
jgi:adenylate kinase